MKNPKISVVIPVFNGGMYIHNAYKSLLSQTYCHWEAIFINDGSTDETKSILDNLVVADDRIIVIHQKNRGAAAARNEGIFRCIGDYITFLDVDDTFEDSALEQLIKHISPNIDIITFGFNMVYKGQIYKKIKRGNNFFDRVEYLKLVMCNGGWELCGKIYRKELFKNGIEIRTDIRLGEDAFVFFQLVSKAKNIQTIDCCLYNYMQIETSAMHTLSEAKANETLLAGQYIIEYFRRTEVCQILAKELNAMMLLFYCNSLFRGTPTIDSSQMKYIGKYCIKFSVLSKLTFIRSLFVVLNYYTNGFFATIVKKLHLRK